ncbi:hypothetical protein ACFWZY_02525 [Streptomyces sp. NPDC058992]|uniref:hypothetical protein n=1 Tax=Streptomyces sp. NPDC058992 TaxID=3346688 RepID=UPI003675208F
MIGLALRLAVVAPVGYVTGSLLPGSRLLGADRRRAMEADTSRAARDVRERRNPQWDRVEEALDAWAHAEHGQGGLQERVVRRGAELQLQALEDLATAMDRTPPERDMDSAVRDHRTRTADAAMAGRPRGAGEGDEDAVPPLRGRRG